MTDAAVNLTLIYNGEQAAHSPIDVPNLNKNSIPLALSYISSSTDLSRAVGVCSKAEIGNSH